MATQPLAPVLVDGCRTPFLRAGTGFRHYTSYQLAAAAISGLLKKTAAPAHELDRVIVGAIVQNPRASNVAREAALLSGVPPTVPAITVTAAGVSATVAIDQAADLVRTGQADLVIAGGSDCISDAPISYRRSTRDKFFAARRLKSPSQKLRFLLSLRPWELFPDQLKLAELSTGETMGEFTEALAARLGISRADQDAYALRSHQRALAAQQAGHLEREIVAVETPEGLVEQDNGIRGESNLSDLASLKPSFDPKAGTLSAGNSSFLTDGAAMVLIASARKAEELGLTSKALLGPSVLTASDPKKELLLGPAHAIPKLLKETKLSAAQVDVVELHEAFAAQVLAVQQLLPDLPTSKMNLWGGSLAIGNPFAPNGARLVTTAANRLWHEGGQRALVATCAGGGLGQALLLETPAAS